jgi:hypothetical protein
LTPTDTEAVVPLDVVAVTVTVLSTADPAPVRSVSKACPLLSVNV